MYGQKPKETFDFQIVLHSDGRIPSTTGPSPRTPTKRSATASRACSPAPPRPACSGATWPAAPFTPDGPRPRGRLRSRAPRSCGNRALRGRQARYRVGRVHDKRSHPSHPEPGDRLHGGDRRLGFSRWSRPAAGRQPNGQVGRRVAAYDRDVDDNRIGLLFDSGEFSGHSTSVRAVARSRNQVTGSWGPRYGEHSAVISFPEVADPAPIDLSHPDPRPSTAQYEVFRYPMIRDDGEGVAHVSCRVIEVLGDHFDLFAFNSEFRVDQQGAGPAHGFAGFYPGTSRPRLRVSGSRGTTRPRARAG